MKNRQYLAATLAAALAASMCTPIFAEETLSETEVVSAAIETPIVVSAETEAEASAESEAETEQSQEENLPYLTLVEAGYESSVLTTEGWTSDFLQMKYVPQEGVVMGVSENEILEQYYDRNEGNADGRSRKVATSEMVAFANGGSYIQAITEVNPNNASADQILKDFISSEVFTVEGPMGKTQIGGMRFSTADGKIEDGSYRLAVSTDKEGFAFIYKLHYETEEDKDLLLKGFASTLEIPAETEAELSLSAPEETESEQVLAMVADETEG